MKFRLTAVIVLALCLSNAFADEGMWLLGNLKKNKQTDRVMRELGLQMPVNKLYNPKKPCLADAVVSFGGFCSGVVVSEDGLVFTNHHCGFSSIQQHSSVEHDYLKDGFVARSLEEELPNPELYVLFRYFHPDYIHHRIDCHPPLGFRLGVFGGRQYPLGHIFRTKQETDI